MAGGMSRAAAPKAKDKLIKVRMVHSSKDRLKKPLRQLTVLLSRLKTDVSENTLVSRDARIGVPSFVQLNSVSVKPAAVHIRVRQGCVSVSPRRNALGVKFSRCSISTFQMWSGTANGTSS